MDNVAGSWHKEAIPEAVEHVLDILYKNNVESFYLAGGTALALHLGHRLSRDLDLFNPEPFDEERLLSDLKNIERISVISKGRETLHLHIMDIKVSFMGYGYPVLFPFKSFRSIKVADPQDIACMKISAIAGRGSRRDFVDLYVLARQYGLVHLIDLFEKKYAQVNFNLLHALKSLTYFKDAEQEPMPKMLAPVSWNEVVDFFRLEAPKII
jgi:hypothetical protein